jgi:hypothetical protein
MIGVTLTAANTPAATLQTSKVNIKNKRTTISEGADLAKKPEELNMKNL